MDEQLGFGPEDILDSINDGVYVTDTTRKIVYWGGAAEQITGWRAADIIGKHCYDGVLCHVDKDGHRLCGEEYCPLHRCIATGQSSTFPVVVFAQTRAGGRVPLSVSVAPIRDGGGEVIGGVETFRDLSAEFDDLKRVKKIQAISMGADLPEDDRIRFSTHYIPHDIVGGDYYAIAKVGPERYGFLLADVTGHGVAAALYTMYLNSLWRSSCDLLVNPGKFARVVGARLHQLTREDTPFAAGVCGVFDLEANELRVTGAGSPPGLLFRSDGSRSHVEARGLPLGVLEDASYAEAAVRIGPGDRILFFTDGATEIFNESGAQLGVEGLAGILAELGYPASGVSFGAVEKRMLAWSDRIRFDDDLTFLEVRIAEPTSDA